MKVAYACRTMPPNVSYGPWLWERETGPLPAPTGGRRAAAIYTFIATAKLNDVDPQSWLADVLARLPNHPAKRIHDLLPWRAVNIIPIAGLRSTHPVTALG